jgi:hypothetical protein
MLISTSVGKHLRANMHSDGRGCNSRNQQRLRPLPPRHNTHADVLDD